MIYLPPFNVYTAGLGVSELFLHRKSQQLTYLPANNLLSDQRDYIVFQGGTDRVDSPIEAATEPPRGESQQNVRYVTNFVHK